MNKKYLVIWRNEDEPRMELVNQGQLMSLHEEQLNKLSLLTTLPSLLKFPSNSYFIVFGYVVTSIG